MSKQKNPTNLPLRGVRLSRARQEQFRALAEELVRVHAEAARQTLAAVLAF